MYFLADESTDQDTLRFLKSNEVKIFYNESQALGHYLKRVNDNLSIVNFADEKVKPIYVDFNKKQLLNRFSKDLRHTELLYKAIKSKYKIETAIDGTAGMGVDSMILSLLDIEVTAFEKNPIVYLLLKDGLNRAKESSSELVRSAARNINLIFNNFEKNQIRTELLYLDFMFDQKDKKSKSKKSMEVFKSVVSSTSIEEQNIGINKAIVRKHNRIVVKRPKSTNVHNVPAYSHSVDGKAIRFDIYLPNK